MMKLNQKKVWQVVFRTLVFTLHVIPVQANILDYFFPVEQKVLIVGDLPKREHALELLKQEYDRLSSEEAKKQLSNVQLELDKNNALIADFKQKAAESKGLDREYYSIALGILNEISQLLLDVQLLRQKQLQTIETHITVLDGYLKEPNFKSARLEISSVYSFADLQSLYHESLQTNELVNQLREQLLVVKQGQEDTKNELATVGKELKDKEHEQATFGNSKKIDLVSGGNWGLAEEAKLLDFEIKLLAVKKEWLELSIKDLGYQLGLLALRLEISNNKSSVLSLDIERIDKSLRVSEAEVVAAQEKLAKLRINATGQQAGISQEIRHLNYDRRMLKQQFDKVMNQAQVELPSLQDLSSWKFDPESSQAEISIYRLAYLNERVLSIDSQIDILESKKTLERIRLVAEEVLVKIITSWHQISQTNLRLDGTIEQEKTKYLNNKLEGQRIISSYRDKLELASKNLNSLSKSLANLELRIQGAINSSSKLIEKYDAQTYQQIMAMLDNSKRLLEGRMDFNRRLIDTYSLIIGEEQDILRQIEMVDSRLGKIGMFLQRSEHAISWENLKNVFPNLEVFTTDLLSLLNASWQQFELASFWQDLISHPTQLLYWLAILCLLVLVFLLIKLLLVPLRANLQSWRSQGADLGLVWNLSLVVIEVLSDSLFGVCIWLSLFSLVLFGIITNLALQELVLLISIPYLSILAHRISFKLYRIDQIDERFVRVLVFLLYTTIVIFCFREAFVLVSYESDLPKVLSALYSVILRAAIIFLISKEELIGLIPKYGAVWELVRIYVTQYYYPLIAGIIMMMVVSDPYILGFNKLVSFAFWGVIFSILLLIIARWVQLQIRKMSAYVFFYSTDVGARERFKSARTWYGLFIVTLYFLVFALSFMLLAKIWGNAVQLSSLYSWLDYDLPIHILKNNELTPLTPGDLLTVVMYLVGGIGLAWLFDKFVLQRIFSLLLVDSGAQNTFSTISKYLIVLVAIFLGLGAIHLGSLIVYIIGALAFGLVWAIKDPVNDFISYFIILLDRTVKIGDFIKVDDRIVGVVRKISPRSVLIRRKNSVSIVVPNSKITTSAVYNWDYTRGFIAFDDLKVVVPYSASPKQVKIVLQKVLSENLNVLKSPAPVIRLDEFGDSGYVFMVRGFLSSINVLNQWDIASDIRLEIVEQLRRIGVPIAAPLRLMVNRDELCHLYNLEKPNASVADGTSVERRFKE